MKKAPWPARLYVWATYRLYHEFSWAYDAAAWLVSLGRWAGWRRMALNYVDGPRILEVGFGTGELLLEMARRGLQAIGLDASPEMQRITARKMRRHRLDPPRVQALAQAMPFVSGCFDAVIATFPAGYILQPETLHEVSRLLRSPSQGTGTGGGRFVVVGMVLRPNIRPLCWAERLLFGVPATDLVERFGQLAREARLCVTVTEHRGRLFTLPVLIAEPFGPEEFGSEGFGRGL